ncbi:hypothetical protein AB1Y20_014974 [Prymnesium parvum]|uniref:cGMP-dependent protein kinase n=1 Tax=Prymnesium parvum TaxID=97485 RepID=A0AB34K171_PRYPA
MVANLHPPYPPPLPPSLCLLPRTLRPRYKPHSYSRGDRELSALSDSPGHGVLSPRPSSASPSPRLSAISRPSTSAPASPKHSFAGAAPSNRSEAAALSWRLEEKLRQSREAMSWRAEAEAYASTWEELVRQVSVHCAERGALLDRVRRFYTRSADAVARGVEKSVRAQAAPEVGALKERCAALEEELAEARRQVEQLSLAAGLGQPRTSEAVLHLFAAELSEAEQRYVLHRLVGRWGGALLQAEEGGALPARAQAQFLASAVFAGHADAELREVLLALLHTCAEGERARAAADLLRRLDEEAQLRLVHEALGAPALRQLGVDSFVALAPDEQKKLQLLDMLRGVPLTLATTLLLRVLESFKMHTDFLPTMLASVMETQPVEVQARTLAELHRVLRRQPHALQLMLRSLGGWSADERARLAMELLSSHARQQLVVDVLAEFDEAERQRLLAQLFLLPADGVAQLARCFDGGGYHTASLIQLLFTRLDVPTALPLFGKLHAELSRRAGVGGSLPSLQPARPSCRGAPLASPADVFDHAQLMHLLAQLLFHKARADAAADARGRPRVGVRAFFVGALLPKLYGEGRAASVEAEVMESVHMHLNADIPASGERLLLQMVASMLGLTTAKGGRAWADAKTDVFLCCLCRMLRLEEEAFAELQAAVMLEPTSARRRQKRKTAPAGLISAASDLFDELDTEKLAAHAFGAAGGQATGLDAALRCAEPPEAMVAMLEGEEAVRVRLPHALAVVGLVIDDDELCKHVMDGLVGVAQEVMLADKRTPVVLLDQALLSIVNTWQATEDWRRNEQMAQLEQLFLTHAPSDEEEVLHHADFAQLAAELELSERASRDVWEEAMARTPRAHAAAEPVISYQAFLDTCVERGVALPEHPFVRPASLATPAFGALAGSAAGRHRQLIGMPAEDEAIAAAPPKKIAKSEEAMEVLRLGVAGCVLFRALSEKWLAKALGYFEPVDVAEGDHVISQGRPNRCFYVCESGSFAVLLDGRKVGSYEPEAASEHFPCFGELGLLYDQPYHATIAASSEGRVWRLSRQSFRHVQARSEAVDPMRSLRRVQMFRGFGLAELQELRDSMSHETVEPGAWILEPGEAAESFYVILSGEAGVFSYLPSLYALRRAVLLQVTILTDGDTCGEEALVGSEPQEVGVRALTRVHLLRLTRKQFESHIKPLVLALEQETFEKAEKARLRWQEVKSSHVAAIRARSAFDLLAAVSTVSCGVMMHVRLLENGKAYTLRQQVKRGLLRAAQAERVQLELQMLRLLPGEIPSECSVLPQMLHCFQDDGSIHVLFEGCVCCSIATLLAAPSSDESSSWDTAGTNSIGAKGLDVGAVSFIGACCVQALSLLQREMLLYRNLLPEHLCVLDNGYVCLMDFRFAKADEGSCRTLCGAPAFLAPEMLRGEVQSSACDWWALGVLMHELLSGQSPWGNGIDDSHGFALMSRIASHRAGDITSNVELAERASKPLLTLLDGLLTPDPVARLGFRKEDEIMSHEFFCEVEWESMLKSQVPSPLKAKAKQQLQLRIEEAKGTQLGEQVEHFHEDPEDELRAELGHFDWSWVDSLPTI